MTGTGNRSLTPPQNSRGERQRASRRALLQGLGAAFGASLAAKIFAGEPAAKVRVLLVIGGHGDNVSSLFEGNHDLDVTRAVLKDPSEFLEDIERWNHEVIVQYHLGQAISEKRKKNFLALMDRGVGVVTIHHALSAFQAWTEYRTIIGGRSYLAPAVVNGVKLPRSSDAAAPRYEVQIADPQHPITQGLKDFVIEQEETYKNYVVDAGAVPLLTTEFAQSDKVLAWTHRCRQARTAYFQPGHAKSTFQHPVYRTILLRAIRWAAE